MAYTNNNGQTRIGVRIVPQVNASSLWNSIYSVYNADAIGSSSLKTSLVSAYNGESNTNDSFGTNNGTAVGGLTYGTGKIGNAFNFNGTNAYVSLPDNSLKSILTGDFSISCWFYPVDTTNTWRTIINCYSGSGNAPHQGFELSVVGGVEPMFGIYNGYSNSDLRRANTFTMNQWNHVVVTRKNGVGSKLYHNGSLVTSNTNTLNPGVSTTMSSSIGAFKFGGSIAQYQANGNKIDSLNVWSKELTQSEITELYNSGNGAQYITDSFYKPTPNDALNTYNGTAQGGLTYGVGKVGTAFQFNGTNAYVSLPDNSLNPSGDFSISFWVKFNSVAPTYINLIENYYAPSSSRYGYNLYLQLGKIRFATYNGTTTNIAQSTSSLSINQWYHITLSKKTSTAPKLYINGVSDTFSQILGNISSNLVYNSLCKSLFGVDYDTSYNSFLNGSLDAINIWNKELTTSEITELYNSGNGKQYPN